MKFTSQPLPEHEEVPLADDGKWEELVETWSQKSEVPVEDSGVYVVSVGTERDPQIRQAQMAEIRALVAAQGDEIVGEEIVFLNKLNPRTLLGKGTSREIAERARQLNATMLVLDAELSPSQMRNLEDLAGIPIADREGVILNVFLQHASSRQARVQVEIARLEYLRPRIRGVGIDMDQQMGGVKGSRGPGETASELLARKLDGRLAELRKVQARLERCGQRQRRQREQCQRLVLVGYTNAGKTSLMNALTEESLSVRNRPFETLDTISRSLSRHGEDVVLSDTVGFIRRLPERLLASFESTLAEAKESSLLVMVLDVSDYEWRDHLATTEEMLAKLEADEIPRFYVYNKRDLLKQIPTDLDRGHPYALVSSQDPQDVHQLKEALLEKVREGQPKLELFVPYEAAEALALIYGKCRVLAAESRELGMEMTVQGPALVMKSLQEVLA